MSSEGSAAGSVGRLVEMGGGSLVFLVASPSSCYSLFLFSGMETWVVTQTWRGFWHSVP